MKTFEVFDFTWHGHQPEKNNKNNKTLCIQLKQAK